MAKKELQDKDYQEHITAVRECLTALGFDCLCITDKDVCSLAVELIVTPERQAKTKKPRPDTECLSGMQSIVDTLSWLDLGAHAVRNYRTPLTLLLNCSMVKMFRH